MKRDICTGCGRPQSVCLCAALRPHNLPEGLQLIVLQDKHEARHKLSTVPLLKCSFPASRVLVGEVFQPSEVLGNMSTDQVALVFPLPHKSPLSPAQYAHVRCLIVLDGTWRKVKKMLLNNPWLSELPHIRLQPESASRYGIRTSPREDGVSTLEAVVMVLNQLDSHTHYDDVLGALDLLVQQQQAFGHKQSI